MSKVELKETIGCSKKFKIEIENERFEQELALTLRKIKQDVQVPGFRKGKAPEDFLMKRFGDWIREEAVNSLIPKVVQEVFKDEGLKPVGDPVISELKVDESEPITFFVKIDELPEIDLSGFDNLKVTKEVQDITEEDIDSSLERMRNMRAVRTEVDRPVEENDIVVVNLQKLDSSGVPIIGEKIDNHVLVLDGHGTPSVEFDKQIIGMKKGGKKKVTFTYDDTISNDELVGTTESYDVELLKVVENRVPDLDDAFAKSVYEEINTLDELRDSVRKNLEAQSDYGAERRLEAKLLDEYIAKHPFEVPDSLVEKVIKSELDNIKADKNRAPVDEKEFRESARSDAVKAVQTYLIVDAVASQNQIDVSKEEVSERVNQIAAMRGKSVSEIRRQMIKDGSYDSIKNDLREKKSYDWLKSKADISVEKLVPSESK